MHPRFRLMLCSYLALTVLSGVPAVAGQAVLCLAPSGHLAIEAVDGRCADFAPTGNEAVELAGPRISPDYCGECVDIPLGTSVLSVARGRGSALISQSQLSAPAGPVFFAVEPPSVVNQSPLALAADARSASQPSRTTILRN